MEAVRPGRSRPAHLVVVGLGGVVGHKYLSCIDEARRGGHLDGYSIVDLDSQRDLIGQRLASMHVKPQGVYLVPDRSAKGVWAEPADFGPILQALIARKGRIKVFISAEVKAHESYLRYCVEHGIDSLVEKPPFAPMEGNRFAPETIGETMAALLRQVQRIPAQHSVMTLGRYHSVYNEAILEPLRRRMMSMEAPLTSLHLRTCSGVWNLFSEYETREDHPYKYGYGMLMHGAYHYVDLVAQFLELNRSLYPGVAFLLDVSSFAAFPTDQAPRIPTCLSETFDDVEPDWARSLPSIGGRYGETDIVSSFALRFGASGKVLTLGTLSLEQTTPSIRAWKDFPEGLYNKNGRVSCTDLEAQLSTAFSIHGRSFKVPRSEGGRVTAVDNYAQVHTRANASLLCDESFNTTEEFVGFTNSSSNRRLMNLWFADEEARSTLAAHEASMLILQALAMSIRDQGRRLTVDLGWGPGPCRSDRD